MDTLGCLAAQCSDDMATHSGTVSMGTSVSSDSPAARDDRPDPTQLMDTMISSGQTSLHAKPQGWIQGKMDAQNCRHVRWVYIRTVSTVTSG